MLHQKIKRARCPILGVYVYTPICNSLEVAAFCMRANARELRKVFSKN